MQRAGGNNQYDHFIKLIVIGDTSVGKTSLLLRFSENTFSAQHIATIGIDFKIKNMQMDGKNVKLQIWDTAGQERFRTITQSYYKGANGILLAFDTTNLASFNSMQTWLGQIETHANEDVLKILVATKCDDTEHNQVSEEAATAFATEHGLSVFFTSA